MEHTSQSELESNKVDAREALAEDRDAWRLRLRLRLDVRLEELLVDVLDELFCAAAMHLHADWSAARLPG